MKKLLFFVSVLILFNSCSSVNDIALENFFSSNSTSNKNLVNLHQNSVFSQNRIKLPDGYIRVLPEDNYARFISKLNFKPLSKNNTENNAYLATINLKTINKHSQFTTNTAFRLYYEYLFNEKEFEHINFNQNKNIQSFNKYSSRKTYDDFATYLEYAFEFLDYNSLALYTQPVNLKDIRIGDIFYHNSHPKSNAVIVVDLAEDLNGNKMMLLAKSVNATNEIHILNNTENSEISPWFILKPGSILTADWRFHTDDLVRFK